MFHQHSSSVVIKSQSTISSPKLLSIPSVLIVGTFASFALMTCAVCNAKHIKTDDIDAEHLLRAIVGFVQGAPQSCHVVRAPMPQEKARDRSGTAKDRD